MGRTIFNQIRFDRRDDYSNSIKETKWEFFIPGINSGVYKPATLSAIVVIRKKKAGFFKLKEEVLSSNISLSTIEFDQLFEEMRKIKELRDNFDKQLNHRL